MTVSIRAITAADKAAWIPLWHAYLTFYKSSVPEIVTDTTFSRFLNPKSPVFCYVAEDTSDSSLVGFAAYLYHASTWMINDVIYLNDLYVNPNTRNGGVGRKLIEAIYDEAEKNDVLKVYWHTQRFNHTAQLLYTKVAVDDDRNVYKKVFEPKKVDAEQK